MLQPDQKLTCAKRCASPFRPSSGCTVVTKEVMREAELAIRTFQAKHLAAPVYVMTDGESRIFLESKNFLGPLHIFERKFEVPDSVKKHNEYHRADAILLKMEVLQVAVNRSGDSIFFDADIVFLEALMGPEDCEVAVSHNLPCLPAEKDGELHGFFNAGMVWTCNTNFPGWWKHQYLNTGGFYEQLSLNLVPRLFRTGYFDLGHNQGFWRGPIGKRSMKSFHLHLDNKLDHKMPQFMISAVRAMRRTLWGRMTREYPEVVKMARKIVGHPQKVFFIHYGKAGGVYVNQHMKQEIVPDYKFYDSWKMDLGRDWSTEELHRIIEEADPLENNYLHQHHIHVTREDVELAIKNGWKTFTFLREPIDTICSLFYWRQKTAHTEGIDWVLKDTNTTGMTLEKFWYILLNTDQKKLWQLPDYIDLLDSVREFSPMEFSDLTNNWFGFPHTVKDRMNESGNPGYKECINNGMITPKMLEDLTSTPEYQAYSKYLKRE